MALADLADILGKVIATREHRLKVARHRKMGLKMRQRLATQVQFLKAAHHFLRAAQVSEAERSEVDSNHVDKE